MSLTLRRDALSELLRRVLAGGDHRDIVVDMIDALFVSDVVQFFERVVHTKSRSVSITEDWYRNHFLNEYMDKTEFAWNSGLNMKTIGNKRQSERREIVIEESLEHYTKFLELVRSLGNDAINIDLFLTLDGVTVRLNSDESMVVINALAVRRAGMRGGAWSTMGKQVEGPLMETLCRIFQVDPIHFTRALADDDSLREVDYYLITPDKQLAKCEVKLMGRGNPEGADAVLARGSRVFVASTLSATNKIQLDDYQILWTELQVENGFLRFQNTLDTLGIQYTHLNADTDHTDRIESAIQETLAI